MRKWGCSQSLLINQVNTTIKASEVQNNRQIDESATTILYLYNYSDDCESCKLSCSVTVDKQIQKKVSNLLLWAGPDAGFDAAVSPPLHPKVCWLPIFQNVEILMPQTFFHEKLESASIDPIMYWSFLVYEGNQENEFSYRDEIKTMLLNILNQSQTWKENLCKWNDPYRPFIIISQRKYVSFWRDYWETPLTSVSAREISLLMTSILRDDDLQIWWWPTLYRIIDHISVTSYLLNDQINSYCGTFYAFLCLSSYLYFCTGKCALRLATGNWFHSSLGFSFLGGVWSLLGNWTPLSLWLPYCRYTYTTDSGVKKTNRNKNR